MGDLGTLGRVLIVLGISIVVIGGLLLVLGRVPWLGRLPGDIRIQRGNFTCFVPIVTSILLSIALTVILNVIIRLLRR